jgi:hypothetical protein
MMLRSAVSVNITAKPPSPNVIAFLEAKLLMVPPSDRFQLNSAAKDRREMRRATRERVEMDQ